MVVYLRSTTQNYLMRALILLSIVAVLNVTSTYGQQKNFPNNWTELINQQAINISYKKLDCGLTANGTHKEYIVLQIANTSDASINLSWNVLTQYTTNKTITLPSTENLKSITIKANETLTGGCEQHWNDPLRIFSQSKAPIGPRQKLIDFELGNLTINIL